MKIDFQLKQELKQYVLDRMDKEKRKVTIISAYPLTDKELIILKQNIDVLDNTKIENKIDENLIAGVVIKFGTKLIDLSLKGELQNLKQLIYDTT
jgi:F-type H+-transporting ATPase subunit delta